jgi:hypothetical protein
MHKNDRVRPVPQHAHHVVRSTQATRIVTMRPIEEFLDKAQLWDNLPKIT